MNKYDDVGFESGRLPQDLKTYGLRRMRAAHDFWVCIIGIVLTSMILGFLAGSLAR